MIYQHLFNRVSEPETVRAGVIGCGDFGSTIVTQAPTVPRLSVPVVADIDVARARSVLLRAGVAETDIAVCDGRAGALAAMEAGKSVVVEDALLMMDLPLHVIVTATRSPTAGALYASEAIRHGKHVVMVDKEADSVVAPILKHRADRAGVVYTTDDGDEPGLLIGLVSWARALGLEVLCGGNTHECVYDPASHTVRDRGVTVAVAPEDRWAMESIPAGEARKYAEARRRLFDGFRPDEECGDPMCHMAVAANGTGLMPDTPTGHRSVVRWTELPELFCPEEEGGVLGSRGAVDLPNILRLGGEPRARNSVFIVVANADQHSREVMIRKGLHANGKRSAMLIYRPYHLCGAETAVSILCAGLLGVPTGSSDVLPRVDIAATAARDFKAGELLSKPGQSGYDRDFRASLVAGAPLAGGRPIPFFMLEGHRLRVDVSAGASFTVDAVERPRSSALWRLREEQDAHFHGTGVA